MESNMRLRLVFEDRKILNNSQRAQGLNRSWILLNPSYETISELTENIICCFDLLKSCSNGLVLSIDDFVLPPFESTSILKENDVIRVRRLDDVTRLADERWCLEVELAEEKLVDEGTKLLTNEDCEESGGYQIGSEEGEFVEPEAINDTRKKTVSKKRKASKKLTRSKKKRKKSATIENGSYHEHTILLEKSPVENEKPFDSSAELSSSGNSDIDERTKNVKISMTSEKRSCQVNENCKPSAVSAESGAPDGSNKKSIGRSAMRRKKKRQWMREQKKAKILELQQAQLEKTDTQQPSVKDNGKLVEEHQQPDECNNEDNELVPIVVKPGHIRFEPFDEVDEDHAVQHGDISVESFQLNGITSKRKGQKWGKEKTASHKRSEQNDLNQESPDTRISGEESTAKVSIDFNTLQTCGTLPQEGDVLAYRLIELSSSWTPEISPFRVGKVSKYDPESKKVTLLQVPEYPIVSENDEGEESAAKLDASPYNEDGSLEIDYPSLVDVRIIEHGKSSSTRSTTPVTDKATRGDQNASSSQSRPISRKEQNGKLPKVSTQAQENGKETSWDDIGAALEAKKAQLLEKDNWNRTGTTSGASWSYRALRGSALGPTIAILRAQNGLS